MYNLYQKIETDTDCNDYSTLTSAAYVTLTKTAKQKNDQTLILFLSDIKRFGHSLLTCKVCYKQYTDKRKLSKCLPPAKKLRSSSDSFNWNTSCLFCGIEIDRRHPDCNNPVFEAATLTFLDSILKLCEKRNDSWGESVGVRINDCIDLPAAEGIHHKKCQVTFMAEKQLHSGARKGRPKHSIDNIKHAHFMTRRY